jgi:hypothetical protein
LVIQKWWIDLGMAMPSQERWQADGLCWEGHVRGLYDPLPGHLEKQDLEEVHKAGW